MKKEYVARAFMLKKFAKVGGIDWKKGKKS